MKEERVPDILIEQYVLGELSTREALRIEKSEGFTQRVAALEKDNAAFAAEFPADVFAVRIRNQYHAEAQSDAQSARTVNPTRRATFRFMTLAVPGAALLVIGLLAFGGLGLNVDPALDPDTEITRLKGSDPQLSVYRSVGNETASVEQLSDGDNAVEGDLIQIAYNAGGRPYGMIVSVDGRGAVTLHYPVTASRTPELITAGEQNLPYGYRLDDAPRFELFYFITSEEIFSVSEILSTVQDQVDRIIDRPDAALRLPRSFAIESVIVRKGA